MDIAYMDGRCLYGCRLYGRTSLISLIFKISVYYTVSFGSNKNNDYFWQGFPLSISVKISVKISVTFLWNFQVSEALFISVRFPTVRIMLRSISAEYGIPEISELRISVKQNCKIAFSTFNYTGGPRYSRELLPNNIQRITKLRITRDHCLAFYVHFTIKKTANSVAANKGLCP